LIQNDNYCSLYKRHAEYSNCEIDGSNNAFIPMFITIDIFSIAICYSFSYNSDISGQLAILTWIWETRSAKQKQSERTVKIARAHNYYYYFFFIEPFVS
jgi:hypothetical protein